MVAAHACTPLETISAEPLAGNYFVAAYPPFSTWTPAASGGIAASLASISPDTSVPWGLYVHVPFCEKRCEYCYYLSFARPSRVDVEEYVDRVVLEAAMYRELPRFAARPPRFIYFGGGTPSLISARLLKALLERLGAIFQWSSAEEITFECSPRSTTREKLAVLQAAGVNRVSLGVQQLDDDVLRRSGRMHLVADVKRAWAATRSFNFAEVNIDLIAGLRGQSDASFLLGLRRAIALGPDCVTIYQLEVPANTPLFQQLHDPEVAEELAGWDEKRRRIAAAFDVLENQGYLIRNAYSAARGTRHSRFVYAEEQYHGADLVGIGLSSFSYVAGMHYQNTTSPRAYADCLARGRLPISRGYRLAQEEQMVREFVLQLKLGQINRSYFRQKYDTDPVERFLPTLGELAARGWLKWDSDCIHLTRSGLVSADRLLPAFYLARHRGEEYW
jgi:oxygen-independent coproporphyrinogen-3 oxidase